MAKPGSGACRIPAGAPCARLLEHACSVEEESSIPASEVPIPCPQDEWDEEKEPEGFLLEGAVPATVAEGADLPNPFFFAFVL